MIGILNSIISGLASALNAILAFLPTSPFTWSFSVPEWAELIGFFIPFGAMLGVLEAYIAAVGLYYLYRVIGRWTKLVGS